MTPQTCRAVLVLVHDGDTIHFDVVTAESAVFHEEHWSKGRRYRLARINAPELSTPEGVVAGKALTDKCATYPTTGWSIITTKQDPYGRYISEVVAPDGTNMSDWMESNGYAVFVKYGLAVEGLTLGREG